MQNKTNQIHDFNPGFGAPVNPAGDRTFWTVAIPSAEILKDNPGAGKAEMKVTNLPIEDYFNLGNALKDGNSVEATVSFDVVWTGDATRHVNETDATNQFAGEYAETQATVTWSGSNADGFSFTSDPANTSTSHFAETGHEHNGIFFPGKALAAGASAILTQALATPLLQGAAVGTSSPAVATTDGAPTGPPRSAGQSDGQPTTIGSQNHSSSTLPTDGASVLDPDAPVALFTEIAL